MSGENTPYIFEFIQDTLTINVPFLSAYHETFLPTHLLRFFVHRGSRHVELPRYIVRHNSVVPQR